MPQTIALEDIPCCPWCASLWNFTRSRARFRIFSEAETTSKVPLTWELAYGGYDVHAQQQLSSPPPKSKFTGIAALKRRQGLFAYPRNRIGRAYFIDVDRARATGALLPQIEDPADRLTPERFFIPRIPMWINAPIPGALGWLPHAWYPRGFRLIGPFISHTAPTRPIRESTFADGDDLDKIRVIRCMSPAIGSRRCSGFSSRTAPRR
jgi:Uncharacterized protein conserved in bacteria (DUF2169)